MQPVQRLPRKFGTITPGQWLLVDAVLLIALLAFLHGVIDPLRAAGVL